MDNGRHTGVFLTGEERNGGEPAIQQINQVISQKSKAATVRKTESSFKAGKSRKHFPKFPGQLQFSVGTKERPLLSQGEALTL